MYNQCLFKFVLFVHKVHKHPDTIPISNLVIPLSPEIPQICRFPKEVGPCRALFRLYFFNMTTMRCEPFTYGGCQGNSNRFQDLTTCTDYCSPRKS